VPGRFSWEDIFENPEKLSGSYADLLTCYKKGVEKGQLPALYFSCGTEDFLYDINQGVKKQLEEIGAEFLYEEGPGEHNWEYWDKGIQSVLKWIFE
jgi:S-formylglutathione hydrolase FrmB